MVGVPHVFRARSGVRGRSPAGVALALAGLVVAALIPVVASAPAAQAAGPCEPPSNAIVCENSKPGSPQSSWMVGGTYGDIVGYGTQDSVQAGGSLPFKVDTPSTAWHIEIYRLGWYGGDGARLISTMNPSAAQPQNQPSCLTDVGSGLVDCGNWAVSATWAVPAGAVSGLYVANFLRDDAVFGANQFPFVVRNDASTSDVVIQTSDQTWQAYNTYGGYSLYPGTFAGSSDGRAYKVSYNRPYLNSGMQNFQNDELPLVRWIERNGYDVSYLSSVDTSRNPALLLNHETFISSGHDEYWNGPQRAGVEQARASGVNLAFFSGNEMFWKTRFEPSIDGSGSAYRTMVCYKETKTGTKIDPSPEWTGTWRDPRLSPPSNGGRPENAVTGTLFRVNAYAEETITVPSQYASMRLWRNTDIANLQPGQTASLSRNSLGFEYDEFPDNGFRPPGAVAMSDTVVTYNSGNWVLQDYGNTYGTGTVRHSLALYRDQGSGALVFGAGTVQWAWGLDDVHLFPGPPVDTRMQQATVNLLADMSAQPQTLQSGLVTATKSTDIVGATATVNSPAAGTTIPAGGSTVISGTATDSGGQVAGVEVSLDGGTTWRSAQPGANGRFTSWTYAWSPSAQGPVTIRVRASDDSANLGATTSVSVTVGPQACPCTLFGSTTPPIVDAGDASAIEVGVRFQTSVNSSVTGVRFYKAAANAGTHTGSLWTAAGVRLATGTFTAETASGWQTLTFANPVPITAGTPYVASYTTTTGHYSSERDYFTGKGAGIPPLTAPASTTAAPQAVYKYGTGFPTSSFRDANYWVDVTVDGAAVDSQPPTVTSTQPAASAVDVPTSASITANFDEVITPGSVQMSLTGPAGAVTGTLTVAGDNRSASFTPTAALANSTAYTASVRAGDGSGNVMPAPVTWSFTTAAPPGPVTCPCSIFGTTTPTVIDAGDTSAVELGVRFVPTASSFVTGVRFFKAVANTGTHTGSLWSNTGQLLATGTFTAESASGWQTLTFATPVAVTGGAKYVASYKTTSGHYSADRNYFTGRGAGVPPVTAPASTATSPNGLYTYGGGFPANSFQDTNYWVDVLVTTEGADRTPPTITGTVPAAGATGVFTDSQVSVSFSEAVDPATVQLTLNPSVPGTTTVASDGRTATLTPTAPLAATTSYTATANASDLAGNPMTAPTTWSFTTAAGTTPIVCPCSIFGSATPTTIDSLDNGAVELGVRFTPTQSGSVSGVRFYKSAANTGTHTGSLWTNAGQLLATGTFTAESASGWQTLTFASPVTVTGGVSYVASYRAPVGRYSADKDYFTGKGAGKPPITAPASTATAPNGLYTTGAGFPDKGFRDTNYYVDALFTPGNDDTPPTITERAPASGASNVSTAAIVNVTFSEPVAPSTLLLRVTGPGSSSVAGEVALAPDARSATFTAYDDLVVSTNYTVTVSAADPRGNPMPAADTWSFTTAATSAPVVCPCTVFGNKVPTRPDAGDTGTVELGMRFTPSVDATVTAVRFYKAAANTGTHTGSVWSPTGQLLGTGTFGAESAAGWQTLTLPTPVLVQAGVGYVVSYLTTSGHYSGDAGYFATTGAGKPPVTAPASAEGAGNGLYRYGGGFPTSTINSTNYWVDVVVTTAGPVDSTPPAVTSRTPAAGTAGVNVNTTVVATFDEPVTAGSLAFTLTGAGSVPAQVTLSGDGLTATLDPTADLAELTTYTAAVTATDVAGNAMTAQVTWTFTTAGTADLTAPTVSSRTPAVGASNVGTGSNVTATFSEPVQPASLSFVLNGQSSVPAAVTLSANGRTATLDPTVNLFAQTTYTASVSATDLAGNAMAAPVTWTFTTGGPVCPCSLLTPTQAPTQTSDLRNGAELGMVWQTNISGRVTGIRFYKVAGDTGVHTGSLWSTAGVRLGTGTFTAESGSGWQQLVLTTPVQVTAGTQYVVSYWSPQAKYGSTPNYFVAARTRGPLTAPSDVAVGNGRILQGTASGFPVTSGAGRNYFVDVVFTASE
ncbi:MAG: DUF4082 domain-containing protein [Geodermatophilaceae bacterium]